MNELTIKLAGIPIGISTGNALMPKLCRAYLTDEPPLFSVSTTGQAVTAELARATEPTTYEYAEALCLYREMAERLPLYGRAVFHGAAIEYGGRAYLFTAPSGVGKSTHIALWRKYLGSAVNIINGDKPVLIKDADGITVCGSPYAGKEGWQRNVSFPLAGVCFLSRGEESRIRPADGDASLRLLSQIYRPYGKDAMAKTVDIVNALARVPCYALACDISMQAVRVAFEAMTGRAWL